MGAGCRVLHSSATGSAQPQRLRASPPRQDQITEQADQSCQDSSRIHAIKGVEQFAYLLGGTLGHDNDLSKPATPNQFGKRWINAKCPGRDSEIWTNRTLPRLTQNRQCTHLSFVQAQHYRVALESRAIRKLNHKSETAESGFGDSRHL